MIDTTASGTSISSAAIQYSSDFTCRYRVRNGGGSPIVPFESTLSVTATGGSGTLLTSCTNNERNGNGVGQILQQSATVDTTGSITLQMSVTFSQTSATLAATQKLFMVEGLN